MKVVITGGCGFIGLRLAAQLLERGSLSGPDGRAHEIDDLVLFDVASPENLPSALESKVSVVIGDIADPATVSGLIERDDVSVFHLASVVSGGGEQDFDLAIRVNLTGGLNVFEAMRARKTRPRMVFASSIAAFGGSDMPDKVGDYTKQVPQTTYGATKAICELLVNDYTRKGFFDGRTARLPSVIIRPGKPNLAASSFVSGVLREPLNGEDFVLPVASSTMMPVLGYRAIVDGIIALHELDGDGLGSDRAVNLPALTVSVQDMIDALANVAHNRALGSITVKPDPFIEAIVATWPGDTDDSRARALGLGSEAAVEDIVRYYIDDYLDV